jgi:hypothetical protein
MGGRRQPHLPGHAYAASIGFPNPSQSLLLTFAFDQTFGCKSSDAKLQGFFASNSAGAELLRQPPFVPDESDHDHIEDREH